MLVAIGSFLFNEVVVAPGTAKLSAWQKVDFGPIPKEANVRTNVWVRDGNNLVNAQTVTGRGADVVLGGITIYDRTENGLTSLLKAEEGRFTGNDWIATGVTQFNVRTGMEEEKESIRLGDSLQPDQFTLVQRQRGWSELVSAAIRD